MRTQAAVSAENLLSLLVLRERDTAPTLKRRSREAASARRDAAPPCLPLELGVAVGKVRLARILLLKPVVRWTLVADTAKHGRQHRLLLGAVEGVCVV